MDFAIRNYKSSDFELVNSWWKKIGKTSSFNVYPEESSYILEYKDKPLLCASLYLLNSPIAAMLENVICDFEYEVPNRKELVKEFVNHLEVLTKSKGYQNLILLVYEDKLKDRWEDLGFIRISNNISGFCKPL